MQTHVQESGSRIRVEAVCQLLQDAVAKIPERMSEKVVSSVFMGDGGNQRTFGNVKTRPRGRGCGTK